MPRRNRVDPWGDLHAVEQRGMFAGNRGCLVDRESVLARHHRGRLWITCVTEFRGRRHRLDAPNSWTPLFFLDDAVALAAGHRPCGECRRDDYVSYRNAISNSLGGRPLLAHDLDRLLAEERQPRGCGLERARDRLLWSASVADLPSGAVVVVDRRAHLVTEGGLRCFSFAGWGPAVELPGATLVDVLMPPTSVAALRHGFVPRIARTSHNFDPPSVHETCT